MRVQIQLRIVADDDSVISDDTELLLLDKSDDRLEALGLSLAEAKTLLVGVQQRLTADVGGVHAQADRRGRGGRRGRGRVPQRRTELERVGAQGLGGGPGTDPAEGAPARRRRPDTAGGRHTAPAAGRVRGSSGTAPASRSPPPLGRSRHSGSGAAEPSPGRTRWQSGAAGSLSAGTPRRRSGTPAAAQHGPGFAPRRPPVAPASGAACPRHASAPDPPDRRDPRDARSPARRRCPTNRRLRSPPSAIPSPFLIPSR